jgi:hypothetical protein
VPSSLAACIVRCLRKDPAERPQHAAEVKAQLEAFAARGGAGLAAAGGRSGRVPRWLRAPAGWRPPGRIAPPMIAASVLLTAIAFTGWPWRPAADTPAAPIHAIAVLPLENRSGDASQDYFADGVT